MLNPSSELCRIEYLLRSESEDYTALAAIVQLRMLYRSVAPRIMEHAFAASNYEWYMSVASARTDACVP